METRLEAVRRILDTATDQGTPGAPYHDGVGRFWQLPRDQFVAAVVYGEQVIVPGHPEDSALIKALKGLPPFDNTQFARMPLARTPVTDADITFIENWITDGCPDSDAEARRGGRQAAGRHGRHRDDRPPRATIAERLRSIEPIESIADLQRHLQLAIEIEHATLPPYLAALYSLKDTGTSGRNYATYGVILQVVQEEMLHLALACNLLNAVGGHPRLAYADFIPRYPTKLPQEDADFEVHIERCSDAALATFQKIEFPNYPLPPAERREVGYRTIGEFYENVKAGLVRLNGELGPTALFSGDPALQVTQANPAPRGSLIEVVDLPSACNAIDEIVEQGEGAHPPGDTVPAEDRPHYFNFTDIRMGSIHGSNGTVLSPEQQFDSTAVWPMIADPRLAGADVRQQSLPFNQKYSDLLRSLETVFNGHPEMISASVSPMFAVRREFVRLVGTPIPNSASNYGPTFEYVDPV